MKKSIAIVLSLAMLLLTACGGTATPETTAAPTAEATVSATEPAIEGTVTEIVLNGDSVTVDGLAIDEENTADGGIWLSRDIVYYEDKDAYESGNPYGEGEDWEKHTAEEAASHLVVNIGLPGNYRISGKLDLGQIRIDLGDNAYEDPNAVVNLILGGVDITCTVAPAILFQNVYECDGAWSVETAKAEVDTTAAGANLILEAGSENLVHGSHVAKVFKDKEGEKKQVKQDGAIYSYMSMNVGGSGKLDLYADNEGLDTELHLTINGGELNIRADNDGINTNEDGVSVTTINGGNLHIIAGLGEEGDGIDSNGYLVINGGTVVASANPAADAGLDSDMGSYIHGGTVVALGSTMDWAESDSDQVTMNLQFASFQSSDSAILVQKEDGTVVFAYDPGEDEVLGENIRRYQGAVVSCPAFAVGDSYQLLMDADITSEEVAGIYDTSAITEVSGGVRQAYTGTDVMMRPGGMGGFGGGHREWDEGERPTWPDGEMPTMPEGMEPPEGEMPTMPEGMEPPEGAMPTMPEGMEPPEGEMPTMPEGMEPPEDGFGGRGQREEPPEGWDGTMPGNPQSGEQMPGNDLFYMQDKVNFFSGVSNIQ